LRGARQRHRLDDEAAALASEPAALPMPITYERDDQRRRIIVTTIGIVGLDDLLAVVDRQAAEGTWQYGVLYDSRRVASVASQTDVRAGLKHVETLSRVHGR